MDCAYEDEVIKITIRADETKREGIIIDVWSAKHTELLLDSFTLCNTLYEAMIEEGATE